MSCRQLTRFTEWTTWRKPSASAIRFSTARVFSGTSGSGKSALICRIVFIIYPVFLKGRHCDRDGEGESADIGERGETARFRYAVEQHEQHHGEHGAVALHGGARDDDNDRHQKQDDADNAGRQQKLKNQV